MGHYKGKKTLQIRRDFRFLCIPGPLQKQKTRQIRRDFRFLCIPGPLQKQKNTTDPQRFSFSLHPWTITKAKQHYRSAEIFVFFASLDHYRSKKALQIRRDCRFLCIPGPLQKQKNTTDPQRFSFSVHPWTTTKAKKHYRSA